MIKHVLIVCIGNICRSPIAEALFAPRVQKASLDTVICSAGLAALVDKPADPVGQALMLARGLDISGHRARQISLDMLFGSDLILTMTTDQQKQVELNYPSTCGREHRIGKWGCFDVPDPFQRQSLFLSKLWR